MEGDYYVIQTTETHGPYSEQRAIEKAAEIAEEEDPAMLEIACVEINALDADVGGEYREEYMDRLRGGA